MHLTQLLLNRAAVVSVMAKEIGVDVSDIIVLRIRSTEPFGLSCTELTVRTFGTSRKNL